MSHRGSLLCLPERHLGLGRRPGPITSTPRRWRACSNGRQRIDTLIIGTGTDVWLPPQGLRAGAARPCSVVLDAMQTGPGHPHLQHPAGRAPPRRRSADRGAMSGAAEAMSDAALCAQLVRSHDSRYPRPCSLPAGIAARCLRSMPSMPRLRACATWSANRCRARSGCNGGATCWWAQAMAAEGNPVAAELLLDDGATMRLPIEPLSRSGRRARCSISTTTRCRRWRRCEGYVNDTASALFSWPRGSWRGRRRRSTLARHAGMAYGLIAGARSLAARMRRGGSFSCRCELLQRTAAASKRCLAGKPTPQLARRWREMRLHAREHLTTAMESAPDGAAGRPSGASCRWRWCAATASAMERARLRSLRLRRMPQRAACCGRCGAPRGRRQFRGRRCALSLTSDRPQN